MPSEEHDSRRNELTLLLGQLGKGDRPTEEKVFEMLRDELYAIAQYQMRRQSPGHTLQASALVNEAYIRLCGGKQSAWNDRKHFLIVASKAMATILIDHARKKKRQKRDPGGARVALDSIAEAYEENAIDLIAMNDALEVFSKFRPELVQIVHLRFFAGLSVSEIAELIGWSERTIYRELEALRVWLRKEIE